MGLFFRQKLLTDHPQISQLFHRGYLRKKHLFFVNKKNQVKKRTYYNKGKSYFKRKTFPRKKKIFFNVLAGKKEQNFI
jgi:hypothetical protein